MTRMTLATGISEDGQTAVIEMHEDGKPLAHMFVDASSLEEVIERLGDLRAHMAEGVPLDLDPCSRIKATSFPSWRIPDTHSGPDGTVLFALRHPGLGWIGYILDEATARGQGRALLEVPVK